MFSNHKYYYWYYSIKNEHLLFNLGTAVFIWCFLFIAKPFGIGDSNVSPAVLSGYLLLFALLWIIISYSIDFLIKSFVNTKTDKNESINLFNFIVKIFITVHSILLLRLALCNWSCIDLLEYAEIWVATVFILGLSYLIYTLHAKHVYFKNMVGKSLDEELVVISSKGRYQFKKHPRKMVYFKSEDNYVRVVYLDKNESLKSDLIRLTLASVEKQLKPFSQFKRVHRSYIINVQYLKNNVVKDNVEIVAGSDYLQLPVSRKYKKMFAESIL